MNRKSILMFNMVFILALGFFNTKIVYGYTVHIKEVLNEHEKFDPNFYSLPESTCIWAGVSISDTVPPIDYIVEVKWDTNTKVLPFQFYSTVEDLAVYKTKLGCVPPTSFDDWDNKSYTLYVENTAIHTDTIADGALRKLATPKAFYNRMTKTISWNSVAYADGYAVRILKNTDRDDWLFNSDNLGLVNQYTFDAAYHSLLDSGAILSVEAWDYIPGNMNNTSIYVTTSLSDVLASTTVTPCRIVDTRKEGGAISAGGIRSYNVWGAVASQGGNPTGCPSPKGEPNAVHVNVTSVPLSNGWITAYPYGSTPPLASLVNYRSDAQNVANSGTVKTCFNCTKDISIKSGGGTTHVIIDVLGYYYSKP